MSDVRRSIERRTRRILFGEGDDWLQSVSAAVAVAVLYFLWATFTGHEIVNLVPEDSFDLLVVLSSVLLAGYVGYTDDGLVVSIVVAGIVWFGGVYYGSTQSAPDVADPGLSFAVFVAIVSAIAFGVPAYVGGPCSGSWSGGSGELVAGAGRSRASTAPGREAGGRATGLFWSSFFARAVGEADPSGKKWVFRRYHGWCRSRPRRTVRA